MEFFQRVREVLRLPQSKTLFEIPKQVEKDGAYWFNESQRKSEGQKHQKCPWNGCDGTMLTGPSGGMSTNIKCDTCERKWNLTEIIGQMERI